MMSDSEFRNWAVSNNLDEKAIKLIQHIRSSEPVRRVRSGRSNVSGFYPSRKMGQTIQFESRTIELAAVHTMEHDPDILEYYDQPSSMKLTYLKNGRRTTHLYTPDFLVLGRNYVEWNEWKTEDELRVLSSNSPNRYIRLEDGTWACPPAEQYASEYGLHFRVRVGTEFNRRYLRNIRFLEDYLHDSESGAATDAARDLLTVIRENPGITLRELLRERATYTADDVFQLLVHDRLYIDLEHDLLAAPDDVHLYSNVSIANASHLLLKTQDTVTRTEDIVLEVGSSLLVYNRPWSILKVDESSIRLTSAEHTIDLPRSEFFELLSKGDISGVKVTDDKASRQLKELVMKASERDLEVANRRYSEVRAYMNGQPTSVSERTVRLWIKKFKESKEIYGAGYIGLLPKTSKQGNRARKLPQKTLDLMESVISEYYEDKRQIRRREVWGILVKLCEDNGVIYPSFKTFSNEINVRPVARLTRKRQGPRAAYKHEPFYFWLDPNTPRHGDRPFEIAHIDHTELDIETVSSKGTGLGRPWATFMVDAYSRRVLAVYLSYDPPSYRSNMMVFRECVRRHQRLPGTIVVDNGKDFTSVYFEALLARYEVTKQVRPPAQARFGSVCERLFGTTNTEFIHNLIGNTQITKNVRQVTKSFNPKNQAIWTLDVLYEYLTEYTYEIYDNLPHRTLGGTPREEFTEGIRLSGARPNKWIAYNEEFLVNTLPSTRKGTAKVDSRYGVKINHIYYWHHMFRESSVVGKSVRVRFDPFDAGIAYAFLHGEWVQLTSQFFEEFKGRSIREVQFAVEELKQQSRIHQKHGDVYAKQIAEFLLRAEQTENLLLIREKDLENKGVFMVIDGGLSKSVNIGEYQPNDTVDVESMDDLDDYPSEEYGRF